MDILKDITLVAKNKEEKAIITRGLEEFLGSFSFDFQGRLGAKLETPYPRDVVVIFPLDSESKIGFVGINNSPGKKFLYKTIPNHYALISPPTNSLVSNDLLNYRVEYFPKVN